MDVDAVVSGATQWGLSRNIKLGSTINTADVGILFDTETDGTLKAYIRKKIGNTVTTEKILTPADIPTDTGVISVNGASGVVSLDGEDIPSEAGSALTVADVLSGHTLDITDLQNQADAIEQDLADYYSTSADYAVGDLVIRNDTLWKCNTTITGGEAWNANHWDQTTVADELDAVSASMLQYIDVSASGTVSTSLSDAYACIFTLPQGKVPISAMILDSGNDNAGYCIAMNPTRRTLSDTAGENGWISRIIASLSGSYTLTVRIFYK